jgi:hypothetical protein
MELQSRVCGVSRVYVLGGRHNRVHILATISKQFAIAPVSSNQSVTFVLLKGTNMPSLHLIRQVFQAAARDAKRARVADMTLKSQVAYILLAAGQQARKQRRYDLAMAFHLARSVTVASDSIKTAWDSLQEHDALGTETAGNTPVSNTGVTETPAAVPVEYFTGGK